MVHLGVAVTAGSVYQAYETKVAMKHKRAARKGSKLQKEKIEALAEIIIIYAEQVCVEEKHNFENKEDMTNNKRVHNSIQMMNIRK